jgi:hypothetical protein
MNTPENLQKLRLLSERCGKLASLIQSLKAEMTALEEQKKDLPLQAIERRSINVKIRGTQGRLTVVRSNHQEILKEIRELAADTRREEGARYYAAMRISKLGVRGNMSLGEDEKA